jgi:hypothetical protein
VAPIEPWAPLAEIMTAIQARDNDQPLAPVSLGDGVSSGDATAIAAISEAHDADGSLELTPQALSADKPSAADIRVEAALDGGSPVFAEQRTVISKRPPIADARLEQPHTPYELGQVLVGKQLAHFQLEEYIGGGMGAVFRGRDLTLGRSVAVKVLPRGQDEDTLRRFKNEAQSAARLNHENIARVYYVGEEDGWNFIIFEHIEGITPSAPWSIRTGRCQWSTRSTIRSRPPKRSTTPIGAMWCIATSSRRT